MRLAILRELARGPAPLALLIAAAGRNNIGAALAQMERDGLIVRDGTQWLATRRAGHVKTMTEQQYPPVANTHQVFFDYVWMVETGERPEDLLADARNSLFEFPDAPKRRIHPYHPPMPKDPFSVIAGPLLTALGLGDVIDIRPRSKDPYPMSQRCVSGDYWQASPWTLECGGDDAAFEYAGEDYLHAYWMGRYHGFLTAAD